VGLLASRTAAGSRDEYWVAGRRIGTAINSLAIMAALASGGSIIGVMGLTYAQGIPASLALFTGAIIGFPLASILVAGPCAASAASPSPTSSASATRTRWSALMVPILIVVSFTSTSSRR
jgi:Na+/proline symporter